MDKQQFFLIYMNTSLILRVAETRRCEKMNTDLRPPTWIHTAHSVDRVKTAQETKARVGAYVARHYGICRQSLGGVPSVKRGVSTDGACICMYLFMLSSVYSYVLT